MAVEFRLLGDVEVLVDGRPVEIGHARQRCVLVALLVDVKRPVPADQLIDRVWADEPPHRVRNALAGYLSRLRTLLGDGVSINREPGGYVVKTDPLAVDLYRFRRLVSDARAAVQPADAVALFDRALELWRGVPLASLDTPWLNDVRRSLEAERLSVLLDRNDVALGVGRHAELLGELTDALHAHPLDERLAGAADAGPVPQRQAGRRPRDLPADAGATRRRARCRSQSTVAGRASKDPRR